MRALRTWERKMGERMGALPGMTILCEEHLGTEIRAAKVDYLDDNDGYAPPVFVIDAEYNDVVQPQDVYAVVLPHADPDDALAQARETFDRIYGR